MIPLCLYLSDAARLLSGRSILFGFEFHNIGHIAFQQNTQLIDGIGGHVFPVLHGIVVRLGKPHFEQPV